VIELKAKRIHNICANATRRIMNEIRSEWAARIHG
jgi:hypothetical protein